MLIDWFTVLAQIVNFIVLVWLLKRVLYKPILKAIADRQNEIAKQLGDAEMKKREAEAESLLFRTKNEEFDRQKAERIKKVDEEIKQLQVHLRAEAKQEIEERRTKWVAALDNEKDEVLRDLSQRIETELFSIMRKAMTDLAAADIQEQFIEVFLQRLSNLPQEKKEQLGAWLQATPSLQVRIAAEATENSRNKIQERIQKEFGHTFDFHFVVVPELIGGIELMANGQKISWNIADYLATLESLLMRNKNPEENHV